MKNIARLIKSVKAASQGSLTHPNREGAPSFYRSKKEQVVQILTTGTLSNTFYASAEQLGREAIEVLLLARHECPEFLAKALAYARNEGLLKTMPVLGLAMLSGERKAKQYFQATFNQVIKTPDDLRAFVLLCKSGVIPGRKGLGGMTRDAVVTWLGNLSEYHTVKYGSAASREITLRDILRLAHPKPQNEALAERFGYLVSGKRALSANSGLNPQIRMLETLKRATTEEETLNLVREGKLPFEVVIPAVKATTPAIWSALLHNAPYFNLLRNLVTFTRHQVFQSEAEVEYAVQRLTDTRAVERSKVLPFRYFQAWQQYVAMENPDSRIADALRQALEISFVNMPSLGSCQIAIGTDTSGSMGSQVSEKSSTRFIDIAGIFTGALLRKAEGRVIPLPFDTEIHINHGLSGRDEILTTTEKISHWCGGGTAVGAPIQFLLDRRISVDVFIGITDQIEWAYGEGMYCSGSFLDLWREYRKQVNPHCKAYLVTIAPYRDAVVPQGEEGIRFIYGWNDSVLGYIANDLAGGVSQMQAIEQMQLEFAGDNGPLPETASEDAQIED
ncbi:MAG: TROVE domain-containing protein [Candidatus Parcubacteria bacterium]|nr:TROVE domain-containing protein [Candidatus Parcubacteria bacterium]